MKDRNHPVFYCLKIIWLKIPENLFNNIVSGYFVFSDFEFFKKLRYDFFWDPEKIESAKRLFDRNLSWTSTPLHVLRLCVSIMYFKLSYFNTVTFASIKICGRIFVDFSFYSISYHPFTINSEIPDTIIFARTVSVK